MRSCTNVGYEPKETDMTEQHAKYGHIPHNWFAALVNKMGGEEQAKRFLRGELTLVEKDSAGGPFLLEADRSGDVRGLRAFCDRLDDWWYRNVGFIFEISP